MTENSGNDVVVSEQGDDQFDFDEFSKFIPLCIRRQILSQMVAQFPDPMKNRLRALKQLQFESTKLEAEFYKEVFVLECKYQEMYNKLHEKRAEIIRGTHEPTAAESTFELAKADSEEKFKDMKIYDAAKSKMCVNQSFTPDTRGIPEFWLRTFRNVYMLSIMVEEHDEPALKALQDIRVEYIKDPMGFILEFHFDQNEYFSNSILTKEYVMKCTHNDEDPFSFDGPEIIKCKGCIINWLPGMNLTTRLRDKSTTYSLRNNRQLQDQYVDSFFNFFSPPEVPADGQDKDEDVMRRLACDYEIAHYIRERIIPHAVLYFTGEGIESEEDDGEEEDDDDDDDDEDESSYCEDEEEKTNKNKLF